MLRTSRVWIAVAIVATLFAVAFGIPLRSEATFALTQIDSVATKSQIESSIGGTDAFDHVSEIAQDPAADFGVRLRAIRALPLFCPEGVTCTGSPAHVTLRQLLSSVEAGQPRGQAILRRRAAIEALGSTRTGSSDDVTLLVPFLGDSSRDLRAATARALRDLCNTFAIQPLRARYASEQVLQVRIAISEALRDLDQCGGQ